MAYLVKMYPSQILSWALALLASTLASVAGQYNPICAYFVQYTGGYLTTERVDPLLSPGVASNHVHSIAGGNGFEANMTFADTQAATCTTAEVSQDKSNCEQNFRDNLLLYTHIELSAN